jgi:hypothetical protein
VIVPVLDGFDGKQVGTLLLQRDAIPPRPTWYLALAFKIHKFEFPAEVKWEYPKHPINRTGATVRHVTEYRLTSVAIQSDEDVLCALQQAYPEVLG